MNAFFNADKIPNEVENETIYVFFLIMFLFYLFLISTYMAKKIHIFPLTLLFVAVPNFIFSFPFRKFNAIISNVCLKEIQISLIHFLILLNSFFLCILITNKKFIEFHGVSMLFV